MREVVNGVMYAEQRLPVALCPPCLPGGISGSTSVHSSSLRSEWVTQHVAVVARAVLGRPRLFRQNSHVFYAEARDHPAKTQGQSLRQRKIGDGIQQAPFETARALLRGKTMKTMLLAAAAALSLGIGSAYANESGGRSGGYVYPDYQFPMQKAPAVATAQNGQAVRAYVT